MPRQLKEFWDSLRECPTVRHQALEVFGAKSLQEISEWWCWETQEQARIYLRGPFLQRVEHVGGMTARRIILVEFGRLAV